MRTVILSLALTVTLCVLAVPAHARYADGPNLYAYVRGGPATHVDPTGATSIPVRGYPGVLLNSDQCDCFPVIDELVSFADFALEQYHRFYHPFMVATNNLVALRLLDQGYMDSVTRALDGFPSQYVEVSEGSVNAITDSFVVDAHIAQPALDHCSPIATTAVTLHEDQHRENNHAARRRLGLPDGDLSGLMTEWLAFLDSPDSDPMSDDRAELLPEPMRKYLAGTAYNAAARLHTEERAFAAAKRFLGAAELALSDLCYCTEYCVPPERREAD